MRNHFWIVGLLPVLACAGSRSDTRPPDAEPVDQSVAASLTPGYCGAWETMDSTSRANCLSGFSGSEESSLASQGDCSYFETYPLDSLHACLNAVDSAARACPVVESGLARQGDGGLRVVEWRRCGPLGGTWIGDSAVYPVTYLLVRHDSLQGSPAIFTISNREEPGTGGLEGAQVIDLDGDGTDEILLTNHIYGTGNIFEVCALAVVAGRWRCWKGPDFPERDEVLRPGEALFKGWIQEGGPPGESRDTANEVRTGNSLWYFTPVYLENDANCCPSANASLWVEARPHNGRFETGLVLRTHEDSNQTILTIDTLRH